MVDWPAGISFIAQPDSFRETGPIGNILRTPMEHGPVKSRRAFTAVTRDVSGQTDIMTTAQIDTFEEWFENDIGGGVLPFNAVNPRTNKTESYSFKDAGYIIIFVNDDKQRLSLTLEQLP